MSDWTEADVQAAIERLESAGAAQSDEARQILPSTPRASLRGAQRATGAVQESPSGLGTEGGMAALWDAALAAYGSGLPIPEAEYMFAAPWRQWRFDWAWPGALVAVELDGMAWQAGGGRHNTDEDRLKLNSAAALGWRVLRFTSRALRTEPKGCIALVRRALERP